MPGIVRRRAVSTPEDDAESDNVSVESGGSISANKRPRLSAQHDTVRSIPSPSLAPAPTTAVNGPLPPFKPGQLVRISMSNFLTYTSATYNLGPTLNMIIGPNGTGKSSVICAICIGLDFSTSLLGRAKELHEFVRHGCEQASIEIEIKGHPGKVNSVVRLVFTKEGGKKSFFLNGRSARIKDIHQLRQSYGIQVDNLCHFLPQDRVVEFSRLSPKDRLRETLRGAASAEMTSQFEQLKTWASDQRDLLKEETDQTSVLKNLESRQNSQRHDVERMQERNELIKTLKLEKLMRPIVLAGECRGQWAEAKNRVRTLKEELRDLNARLEPSMQAIHEKEAYAKSVKVATDGRKRLIGNFQRVIDQCQKAERDHETRAKEVKARKDAIRRDQRDFNGSIQKSNNKIHSWQNEMATSQPIELDTAEINLQIRNRQREVMAIEEKVEEIKDSGSASVAAVDEIKDQIREAEARLRGLHTQSGRQLELLQRQSPDTAKAWAWVQKNKDGFKGQVFGPPVLECSLTEERFAPMIESLFNRNDMLRIVVTEFEDLERLTHELQREGLTEVNVYNARSGLNAFRPPISEEQASGLGVEGWALDYIKGPEPVRAMMCDQARVHATAVSWDDVSEEHFRRLDQAGLTNLVTSRNYYRITRRKEYGPDATSTMVRSIPNVARWWTSAPVEAGVEDELKRSIADWQDQIVETEAGRGNVKERLDRLRMEKETLMDTIADIQRDKDEKQRHNATLEGLPVKIENEKANVEDLKQRILSSKEESDKLREESRTKAIARAQNSINWATAMDNMRNAWTNYVTAAVNLIEAQSDVARLRETHSDAQQMLDAKQQEAAEANDEKRRAKADLDRALDEWLKTREEHPELNDYLANLSQEKKDRLPNELELDISSLEERIQMGLEADPRTIREFEDRAKKIDKLQGEVAAKQAKIQAYKTRIEEVRGSWEQQLDELVAKISDAFATSFEKINCLGCVEVGKSTDAVGEQRTDQVEQENGDGEAGGRQHGYDFENWTIEIRVAFREGEPLSVLDSHRQSGGERAVTTIYYLMALQALSVAPFRVVDEINQGMDPRNERVVHERLVDISCNGGAGPDVQDGGSQYFLVTPKLLPGLKYDSRMKVHVVVSGEFMPQVESTAEAVTFPSLLKRILQLKSQPANEQLGSLGAASPSPSLAGSVEA